MRACPECGTVNEDGDDFCGNCGAYLGWQATSTAGATGATEERAAPAEPPSGAPAEPQNPVPAAEPPSPPATEAAPPRPRRAQPEPEAGREVEADRTSAPDPVAVQPAKPIAQRPVVRQSVADDAQDGPRAPGAARPTGPTGGSAGAARHR